MEPGDLVFREFEIINVIDKNDDWYTGYIVGSNGQCDLCNYPCETCNPDGSCATCAGPYYAEQMINGACVVNSVLNCAQYNPANTSLCTACNAQYTLNTTSNVCVFNCNSAC